MGHQEPITAENFVKRLINLCLKSGLSGFPKDETSQQILLKSAALVFNPGLVYDEKQVNEILNTWIEGIGQAGKMDHGTMRRYMVDAGYLSREKDGSSYRVAGGRRAGLFAADVDQVTPLQEIASGREAIAARKRAYLEKAQQTGTR